MSLYKTNGKENNMETNYLTTIIGVLLGGSSSGLVLQLSPSEISFLLPSILILIVIFMVVYQQLLTKIKESEHLNFGNILSGLSLFLASIMLYFGIFITPNFFMVLNGISFVLVFISIFENIGF